MTLKTIRWIVFSFMYLTLILPVYLQIRTHWSEWLWMYAPILSFWTCFFFDQYENQSNVSSSQEVNNG